MSAEPPAKRQHTDHQQSQLAAYKGTPLELKCINTIRTLAADMVQKANSGHPGAPMGCAPMAHLLWSSSSAGGAGRNHTAKSPGWWNRDRFVLSNGHACALQYVMLHLSGYEDCNMDQLKQFRQVNSHTPGHPENFCTAGVEVCTGPLGQGISNAVGMAIAAKHLGANYNTPDFPSIINSKTYVICGDGCLQEGISGEACSLAGHLGLGDLIVLYDDNHITIDGDTDLAFTEDVKMRYESYGWQVLVVDDVANGLDDLRAAIEEGKKCADKPTLIKVRTEIGYGSPNKQGKSSSHGAPLGVPELEEVKSRLYGMDPTKSFSVDDDVAEFYNQQSEEGDKARLAWEADFAKYKEAHPEKAAELERRFNGELPDGVFDNLPKFEYGKDKPLATRKFSEASLNSVAPSLPELMGGSADLTGSNLCHIKGAGDFQKDTPEGRMVRFGVREHAMAAICNGMFSYGGIRPFCATFLQFAGYALGAMRVSALSKFGVIYIMTHDSIGLGEDGPTHQPVEMLESLRSMPNMNVLRAADSNEMAAAYQIAIEQRETPSVICATRGTVQPLEHSSIEKALKGGYTVLPEEGEGSPDLVIVATGSEVWRSVDAAKALASEHSIRTRVVSMPCQEIFLQQSKEYQLSVLPGNVPTLSVEASAEHGWHRFSHAQIGLTRFGMSGPLEELFIKFGFGAENVAAKGKELVEFYKNHGSVPDLNARPTFVNFQSSPGDH
jgi:transketolase